MDLMTAIETKSFDTVRSIVEKKGIPIDDKWTDYALLNKALKLRKIDIGKYLLEKNCRVNKTGRLSSPADTPLHYAVKLKDIGLVKCLLEKKASVEIVNAKGESPLHLAFINEQSSIVDLLLSYIAENDVYINSKNQQGLSHFHIACTREDGEIIYRFLEEEASASESVNEDSMMWSGYTALHFAVQYKSLEAVKILSIELKKFDDGVENDIKHSCTKLLHKDIEKSLIIADLIAEQKMSYFDLALARKDTDTIKNYFANGVNLGGYEDSDKASEGDSDEDESNNTNKEDEAIIPSLYPLHLAVKSGSKENVKLLLDQGANINDCNNDKMTPLHLAFYNEMADRNDAIVALLYKTVDMKEKNHTDNNGLSYLHVAVTRNDLKTVEYYLDAGNNVDSQVMYDENKFYHFSPLHFAVLYENKEMAKLLIDRGANVNLSDDYLHGTPLRMAVRSGNVELIELLLEGGADVKAVQPKNHKTVLHQLMHCLTYPTENQSQMQNNLLPYIKRFVTMGCDINAQDNNGDTVLHLCCTFSYKNSLVKCLVHLLQCGADINLQNRFGITPLEYYFSICSKCEFIMVLYEHVEKLKALGMMVHPRNIKFCKDNLEKVKNCIEHGGKIEEKLSRAEKERLDEIAKLKKTFISNRKDTSLCHLLNTDLQFTYINFSVSFLEKILEDRDFEKHYPSYGYLVRLQCQRFFEFKRIKASLKRPADDDQFEYQRNAKHLRTK